MEFDIVQYKSRLIRLFETFDSFCRIKELKYSICAGTMLGAVRHGGMIPWDDDIDVIMPREDYDKFISMTLNGLSDAYDVLSAYNCKNYYVPFAKVIDANTTLIETAEHSDCPIGVFLDVFPVDGIPQDERTFRRHEKNFFLHLKAARILGTTETAPWNERMKCFACSLITDRNREFRKADEIASRYPFETSRFVQVYGGGYGELEILDRSIFEEYVDMPFDGMTCRCIRKIEYYLTRFYGDFMRLPPEKDRRSHHEHYFIDLNRRWTKEELRQKGII